MPVHNVTLSTFYIGKYELSWGQWKMVRDWAVNNGYADLDGVGLGQADDHPVHSISWYDAVKWCNAASEQAGLNPVYRLSYGGEVYREGEVAPYIDYSARGYRLPTEAEWEKAARGGFSGHRFPWGDEISHSDANYKASNLDYDLSGEPDDDFYHPEYESEEQPYTAPVGSFAPNAYGLYGMVGNVMELCNDWLNFDYYSFSPITDPQGDSVSSGFGRTARGGSWIMDASYCRVAYRQSAIPETPVNFVGFRLAVSE